MKTLFTVLLQVAFIVLKLTNVIQWNWFTVLLPFILYGLIFSLLSLSIVFFAHAEVKKEKRLKEYKRNNPIYESKFQKRMREMMENAQKNKP